MALLKYSRPENDVFNRRFSDIMDEFFNDAVATRKNTFAPSIDISESDNQFIIDVEVPGINKKDIELNFENNMLTISGERSFNKEEEGKQYHRVESHYGTFNRSFRLPDNVDSDSIKATYNNGILNITVDKGEEKIKKQIEIK